VRKLASRVCAWLGSVGRVCDLDIDQPPIANQSISAANRSASVRKLAFKLALRVGSWPRSAG
ncbi:MAG: hypothetical protein ACREOS_08230, partial [Candidatus Dormibacteraceae bacterium]